MKQLASKALILTAGPFLLAVSASAQVEKIYWTNSSTGSIKRVNPDGTGVETLLNNFGTPLDLAFDRSAGKMYWTDLFGPICRAALDGSGIQQLVNVNPSVPVGIALDIAGGKMYWAQVQLLAMFPGQIRRANLDGTNVETVVATGVIDSEGLDLDVSSGQMYWTEFLGQRVRRANFDGTGVQTLVDLSGSPLTIALDLRHGKMYWADFGAFGPPQVQRANLDGSALETLPVTSADNGAIAIDRVGDKLYYTDSPAGGGNDKLRRSNLDGSSEEILLGGLDGPLSIELLMADAGNNYCISSPNSTGAAATISSSGTASVTANELVLYAAPVPDQPGLFFYGPNQVQLAFGNGTRCVGGTIGRLSVVNAADNAMSFLLDNTMPPNGSTIITPGTTWNFQAWFRDPVAGGAFFDLSDGLNVVFGP